MNWENFHFIRPLWLLAFIPALFLLLAYKRQLQTGQWENVCDAALLPYLIQYQTSKSNRLPLISALLALSCSIFALAGPTWQRLPSPAFRNDSALVIALNLAESMNASDIKPSRLIRARYKISDILRQRKDGQTALLVYAGDAFTVTPLTNDTATIDSQLSALTSEIMPSSGSNAGLALEKAAALLKQAGLQKGHILLITDTADLEHSLPTLKHLENYTVSVMGVGTADGAPIKAAGGDFVKDAQGNIVIPKVNNAELARLATSGKGVFLNLRDDNQDTDTLAALFNQAETQTSQDQKLLLEQWADQGPWLIIVALPFAALWFRKGLLVLAVLITLPFPKSSYALTWQDLWQTPDQQAQQAYKQQNYTQAAQQFTDPSWRAAAEYKAGKFEQALDSLKTPKTANDWYNQGNALAQSGKLPEALKAYEQALKSNPNDADTLYNKDLVEKELKKQQEQQKKSDSKSEQPKDQQQNDQPQKDKPSQDDKHSSDPQKGDEQAQKPESQSSEPKDPQDKKTEQQQADQQQAQQDAEKKAAEQKSAEQPAQNKPEDKPKPETESAQAAESKPEAETQQANEQWLKRIPDDPAGLLKRKFKYQYSQRNQQQ